MPRMVFNPRIQDNIAVPDDMPDDEVQAIFMEADAEQRSAQGYPPVANLAQFLGGMYGQQQQFQPQTTLPNISGKDTYGMSPEQTANLIGTFQQDAQSKVDQQFKMRAENERRMEAEKDRSQQLKLEAARMKNDAMDRKLREQQHKDSLDMDEKRLVQDESQSVRAFNQNATDSQRQYDLDVQQGRVSAANQAAGNSLQAQQLQAQIDRDNTALMEGRIDRGLLGLQNMRKANQEKTDAENLNIYRMGTIGVNQDKADNNYELGLMRVAVQEGRMSVEEFNAISRRMGVAVSDKRADIYGTSVDNQGRRIDSQNTTDQQNTDIRGRQVDGTLAQGDRRLDQGDRKLGQADRGLDIRENVRLDNKSNNAAMNELAERRINNKAMSDKENLVLDRFLAISEHKEFADELAAKTKHWDRQDTNSATANAIRESGNENMKTVNMARIAAGLSPIAGGGKPAKSLQEYASKHLSEIMKSASQIGTPENKELRDKFGGRASEFRHSKIEMLSKEFDLLTGTGSQSDSSALKVTIGGKVYDKAAATYPNGRVIDNGDGTGTFVPNE